MLSCLEQVRLGVMRPETFRKAEITRRTLNFTLSSIAVVEPVFSGAIFSLDVDSTGRFLLSGASDGTWYIHDTFNLSGQVDHSKKCVSQCPRRLGHTKSISTVEWYPVDSGLFITSSYDGKLCLWDPNNSSSPVDQYDLEESISRHQINPNAGTMIAACSDGEVHLIDLRAGTSIQKLPETLTKSKEVRWNPANQHQLLVGSEEGHLIEWDVRSTLTYRGYGLLEVRVARRGVRTRDFKEQVSLLQKAHNGGIRSIRFRKDGMEFYSLGGDGKIRRWLSETNPTSEPLVCTLNYGRMSKGHGNYHIDISGDTDPPLVFAPKSTSIVVGDMKECRIRNELIGHFKQVNCFVYDDNFQQGYSGGNDSSVMVWSGNLTSEQTFIKEKASETAKRQRSRCATAANNRQLTNNLIDDDDEFDEYEVASSSSDNEVEDIIRYVT